jgi:hypothetical protein
LAADPEVKALPQHGEIGNGRRGDNVTSTNRGNNCSYLAEPANGEVGNGRSRPYNVRPNLAFPGSAGQLNARPTDLEAKEREIVAYNANRESPSP